MLKRSLLFAVALVSLAGFTRQVAFAQKAPAPKRDLTGTWEPVRTIEGIQPPGAQNMPADGKPEHELPYTPFGLEMFKKNHPSNGPNQVSAGDENDPGHYCDPHGFPRENLFELRATQFIQSPTQLVLLYTYGRNYRVIWSDGRELPVDPDPHWFGYSVGKWMDDYTFVVKTNGTDSRTWLDNAGRPHSEDLIVEEQFHRVDHDTLELTTIINDPKVYTKPWVAQNKLRMHLLPANFDLVEMMCSPSELNDYNRRHGNLGTIAPKK